ncbi:MAG: R3H domain-containing nucleic acid-binding protein [Myxococcota bacterium]
METGQEKVTAEGRTLGEALRKAAEVLGVPADFVSHEFDREHFRTPTGRSRGVDTVRIFAWSRGQQETAGATAARDWLSGLIEKMGFESEIKVRINDKTVDLLVSSSSNRHLVGRRGTTLRAIQQLMDATLAEAHEGWTFRIDVLGGDRDRDRDRDDDRRGRDRDDDRRGRDRDDDRRGRDRDGDRRDRDDGRRDRRGRDRDRDRDGDRRDRRRRRDRDDDRRGRGRGRRRNDDDVAALEQLARKLAKRVMETGKSIVVRQELNSFERRVIHVTVGDIDGVDSQSFMQDGVKRIRLMADGAEE